MKPLTLQQIRQATGGRALTRLAAHGPFVSAVCTDTRRMEPGSLFIAIKGDNFDAHTFLSQAAAGGAIAALVQDVPEKTLPNVHLIHVPDTRIAMGKLATFVRKQMRSKVIAVAGSNGKTSTKYLIDAALRGNLKGSISPKSFNNDIGVPLTIFPADPMQDYLVLEMGTNHPGEISRLAEMALPDIAVITNCGPEHLEFLGDLMGVRRENASIVLGLNPKGVLIVNGDDPELLEAVRNYEGKIVTFGFKETNDVFATEVECDETGVRFRLNNGRQRVFVPMLGRHTAANALAAIAVARRMGLMEEQIIESLAEAHGPEMRLQLNKVRGITLINDAYNANPASMKAALETVKGLNGSGRTVAVLGDMKELGASADRFHREVGTFVAECGFDALYCVGTQAALIAEAAIQTGMNESCVTRFDDAHAAAKTLAKAFQDGDTVLLKASRGIGLEVVAQAITEGRTGGFFRKVAS
jgi:UDP-N-acetylmuramoyl-tripeptide--D-alanyl-D-alanine ligase